jgi:hypothetical protein
VFPRHLCLWNERSALAKTAWSMTTGDSLCNLLLQLELLYNHTKSPEYTTVKCTPSRFQHKNRLCAVEAEAPNIPPQKHVQSGKCKILVKEI